MTRDEAYTLLQKYMQNKNLLKHSLAAEAAMRAICEYQHPEVFNDPNKSAVATAMADTWGISGLLHDIDYEVAQKEGKLDQHGMLLFVDPKYEDVQKQIPEEIIHAIKAHNLEGTGVKPQNHMDWAIANVDALTGLIVACALIHPDKKLASIDTDFVMKRFSEKAFAKGARRESIKRCEETMNIPLETFVTITLKAMQDIHEELGL